MHTREKREKDKMAYSPVGATFMEQHWEIFEDFEGKWCHSKGRRDGGRSNRGAGR
jgi:hypothetical protein